jgi:hypothetical protein
MAVRRPETMAKRAREQAVRERRDEKRAKKQAAAAARNAPPAENVPGEHAPDDGIETA